MEEEKNAPLVSLHNALTPDLRKPLKLRNCMKSPFYDFHVWKIARALLEFILEGIRIRNFQGGK